MRPRKIRKSPFVFAKYNRVCGRTIIGCKVTRAPFYGYRKITARLNNAHGFQVNHKRIARLMTKMGLCRLSDGNYQATFSHERFMRKMRGLQAVHPRRRTTVSNKAHKKYPYLLRGLEISQPNQVWCADITYVPMPKGFMYLMAIMDWFSRFVLAWQLSNTLDNSFCLVALQLALHHAQPKIFNTDQGVQFTSRNFTGKLEAARIQVSLDGRGRVFDNIFVERLWRSAKYEDIYLKEYDQSRNWLLAWKTTSSFTTMNGRTRALATWYLLMFILLLMYQFCDPMFHLNVAD